MSVVDELAPPTARRVAAGATPYHDPHAEQSLAAAATWSTCTAAAIAGRLSAEDFYDPMCWAVIQASRQIHDTRPAGNVDPWWREHTIADHAGVPRWTIQEWCAEVPSATDATGHLTDCVTEAAARRRAIHAHLTQLEQLGVHVTWGAVS